MQIRKIYQYNQQEIDNLVNLHWQTLKESTLNKFGKRFLIIVYKSISLDANQILLVIENQGQIVGLAVATPNIKRLYNQIINKNFFPLFFEVIKHSLSTPSLIIKTGKWLLAHSARDNCPAELLFIAVDKNYQGQGLGSKLIKKIIAEFHRNKIHQFKVGTWANNNLSNRFYVKLGFKFLYQKNVLGQIFNYYLSPDF